MKVLCSSKLCLMVKDVIGACLAFILASGWLTISDGVCSDLSDCCLALHLAWVWHSSSFIFMAVADVRGVGIGYILAWLSIPGGVCSGLSGCGLALLPAWVWHSSSIIMVIGFILILSGVWSISRQCWVLHLGVDGSS